MEALRQVVADLTNARLAAEGVGERVDPRTLSAQAQEAEALGDYDTAAALTREPLLRVPRAEVEAERRGEPSLGIQENRARKVEHQKDLAAYLVQAKQEGRLMPASTDRAPRPVRTTSARLGREERGVRVTGRDAALLNGEAAQRAAAAEEGRKVTQAC